MSTRQAEVKDLDLRGLPKRGVSLRVRVLVVAGYVLLTGFVTVALMLLG